MKSTTWKKYAILVILLLLLGLSFGCLQRTTKSTDESFWENEDKTRKETLEDHSYKSQEVELEINLWPGDYKAAFNLNFDDFAPRTEKSGDFDYGGKPREGINALFVQLLKMNPQLKATLFTIPNSSFRALGKTDSSYKNKFLISKPKYQKWTNWIHSELVGKGQVEIAAHGYRHFQDKVKSSLQWSEFEYAKEPEIIASLTKAQKTFAAVEIEVFGLRPPGWGLGKDFAVIGATKKLGFEYGALSTPNDGLNEGQKRVSNIFPVYYKNLLNFPDNIGIDEPLTSKKSVLDKIIIKNGLISMKGHYTNNPQIGNRIDRKNIKNTQEYLDYLERKYPDKIWFATIKEIADFWIAKKELKIKTLPAGTGLKISLLNNSPYDLRQLSIRLLKYRNALIEKDPRYSLRFDKNRIIVDIPAREEVSFIIKK